MAAGHLILKLLSWPHSLWLYFLLGLFGGMTGVYLVGGFDELLSEDGKRMLVLAIGCLSASVSARDSPRWKTRIERFFWAIFIVLTVIAFAFLTPTPSEKEGDKGEASKPRISGNVE